MKLIHTEARGATHKRRNALQTQAGRSFLERGVAVLRGRVLPVFTLAMAAGLAFAGTAMAQATSPTGGLGAQLNTMSSEATNSGSLLFAMACYLGAALCFGFGVWALWQSRQPQNRESGHIARGIAGLVLCGHRHGGRLDEQGGPFRRPAAMPRSTPRRRWCSSARAADGWQRPVAASR